MKLKNMLIVTFLTLTIIPIAVVSVLLYKSGVGLSKESYTRNLTESLNVQADYISQTIENNMIEDFRFANHTIASNITTNTDAPKWERDLHTSVTAYLNNAEDKIAVCMILDENHLPIYSIGEKAEVDTISVQLPEPSEFTNQTIMEFDLSDGTYSIGIVTPVWDQNEYRGCLVSVYDKSYIFKIISSYYKTADTSTYICRENGDIVNSRQSSDEDGSLMAELLHGLDFDSEGTIDTSIGKTSISGYYKNIHNTPWYLAGFVDDKLIYSFANQFLPIYFLMIFGVLIIDIVLSFYFSSMVVKPINRLIKVMEVYQNDLDDEAVEYIEENEYVEAKYLRSKFSELMQKILLVQHNFEGIYQLYRSNNLGDINIDIDVANQSIESNKESFQGLFATVEPPQGACIVEKFTHCFCVKDQELLLKLLEEMRDEHLSVTREIEVYTPYLEEKWFHALVVPMYTNERLSRLFIQLRDVTSFKKQEIESNEKAKRDMLTGLYNREGFISCVDKVIQTAIESDLHALFFIDMDYFKLVNDNFGHTAGDDLLRSVSKTLQEIVGPNDIVSRFGGDEFALFLTRTSLATISKIEQSLKSQLVYPFHTGQASFVVSASIGVSTWCKDSPSSLQWLLQQADSAMYNAKREFKHEQH